jgi:hypothetical protein
MHLLIRHLSPYTAEDLLLGVYLTVDEAARDRAAYLSAVLHGGSDPHAEQAYHDVSDADVAILSDLTQLDAPDEKSRVYVVSSYAEGFGQVRRTFEAIVGSESAAREHATAPEARDDGNLPFYCDVDEVSVGVLSTSAVGHSSQT